MLQWLSYLEMLSGRLAGVVLILPGLVGLLLGIALWLGGSLGRRGLVAITAVMTGVLLGFWVAGRSGSMVGGLGLAMATLIMPRLLTGVIASFWVSLATMTLIAAMQTPAPQESVSLGTGSDTSLTTVQSIEALLAHVRRGGRVLLDEGGTLSWSRRCVLVAIVIAMTSIMALLPRLGRALYHAVIGTVLVTWGMGLLLLQKDSEPLLYAWGHAWMMGVIWAAMVLFGATIQWLCCGLRQGARSEGSYGSRKRPHRLDLSGTTVEK